MTNIEDITEYEKAWTDMMIHIWDEKLTMLGVYDTGALVSSLTSNINGDKLTFRFLEYGVYVDSGVGYNYSGWNGDIQFLDDTYRYEHGLDQPKRVGPAWGGRMTSGKPRQKKPWFNRKFYSSTMKLKADLARIIGESFAGIIQEMAINSKSKAKRPYGIRLPDL